MGQIKVGIAMSGGVDSSVAASLLQRQGFAVEGFFMRLPLPGAEEHAERVRSIAGHLNVRLHCVDMKDSFTSSVIEYFTATYTSGQTPNPCIICNRQIKFGTLLDSMRTRGMQKIATGHYARLKELNPGQYVVRRGRDPKKDQSYFLCRLAPGQLENIILPLGDFTKQEVYGAAAELHLRGLHGPESQDVCFLADSTLSEFFARQGMQDRPGDIVDSEGRLLGRHRGLWHYTIGQRKGLGLPDATPWYVQQLDAAHNRLVVCKNESLATRVVIVRDVMWTEPPAVFPWKGKVRIRGRHREAPATLAPADGGRWTITFAARQRAATPGQFAAFYQEDYIVGSGIIADPAAADEAEP